MSILAFVVALFSSLAGQPNLLRNGGLETPVGSAKLEGWNLGPGRAKFEPGVRGRCLRYRPAANKPYWEVALESDRFPLEPGKRYLGRVWVKAKAIRGLHVKFYYLRADTVGKPGRYDRAAGEYYELLPSSLDWQRVRLGWEWSDFHAGLPGQSRSGTWDWQQWEGVFRTTRKALTQGKVEVWVERKGGELWLDELSVKELGQATARALPRLQIRRQMCHIGDAHVEVLTRGGIFVGIGRMRLNGFEVRAGDVPWRMLVFDARTATPGVPQLLSTEQEGQRLVVAARFGHGADAAEMTWEFEPASMRIGGAAWGGIRTRWKVRWPRRTFKLLEVGAWQPAGGIVGALQRADTLRPATAFAPGAAFATGFAGGQERKLHPGVVRFGGDGVPSFDWLEREGAATLLVFHERPMLIRSAETKPLDWDGLLSLNYYCFRPAAEVSTPWEYVLVSKSEGFDAWVRVRDGLYRRWRGAFGLHEFEPLPAIQLRWAANWVRLRTAEQAVREAAAMGFKRVLVYTPWHSDQDERVARKSGCAPWALEISPRLGLARLRRICQVAHSRGLRVFTWLALGHLSNHSPLLKAHPEWSLRNQNGSVYTWGYPDLTCVSALTGWADYVRTRLRALNKETGLDGFWLDSYWNFGLEPIQYAGEPAPQFEAYLRLQRDLEQMGYECLVEAHSSPFGLPAHGFPFPLSELAGRERVGYKTSPFITATAEHTLDLPKVDYFALLANKCTPILFFHPLMRQEPSTWFREMVRRANEAYNAMHGLMDVRRGSPDGSWVEWRDAETGQRVVFALRDCDFPLAAGRAADVLSGAVSASAHGKVTLRAHHVYRIHTKPTNTRP